MFAMKPIACIAVVGALGLPGSGAHAQSISRSSGNFSNIPPCPGKSNGAPTTANRFPDGVLMPSCGGREQHGDTIVTYELVWTGRVWAEYTSSVRVTTLTPAGPAQPPAIQPLKPNQFGTPAPFRIQASQLGYQPNTAPAVGSAVTYGGKMYRVVQLVGPSGGTIISHNGSTVISSSSPYDVVLSLITNDGGT